MRNITITFLFIISVAFTAWAQPIRTSTPEAMLKEGEAKLALNDYYNALELFEKAYKEIKPSDNDLAYQIATLHHQLRDYVKAERWYKRVINRKYRKGGVNPYLPDIRLTLGRVYKMNAKYIEAIEELRLYIIESEDPNKIDQAKIELAGAEMALPMQDITGMQVVNAGKRSILNILNTLPFFSVAKCISQQFEVMK